MFLFFSQFKNSHFQKDICLLVDSILCLPYRRVRQAERYNWAATRGVNEEMLLENLPEDLQTDIRRHLFEFVKKVCPQKICCLNENMINCYVETLKGVFLSKFCSFVGVCLL